MVKVRVTVEVRVRVRVNSYLHLSKVCQTSPIVVK